MEQAPGPNSINGAPTRVTPTGANKIPQGQLVDIAIKISTTNLRARVGMEARSRVGIAGSQTSRSLIEF